MKIYPRALDPKNFLDELCACSAITGFREIKKNNGPSSWIAEGTWTHGECTDRYQGCWVPPPIISLANEDKICQLAFTAFVDENGGLNKQGKWRIAYDLHSMNGEEV